MVYKVVIVVFWITFWAALLQERVWTMNRNWIFAEFDPANGCPVKMTPFWSDYVLGLIFEIELTIVHQLFFTAMLYYDFFVVRKKYGFLKITQSAFLIRYLVIIPLIEIVRVGAITLICLSVFALVEKMNVYLFIFIVMIITTLVVLADVSFSGKVTSCVRGKLTPLEEKDPELDEMIHKEWEKFGQSSKL